MGNKPEWLQGSWCSYDDIVKSWGHEVLEVKTTGSWQGDYVILLRDSKGRLGIATFGYGSCSGCDALQAVEPISESGDWSGVEQLRKELEADIYWFKSADGVADWINSALVKNGNNWFAYDTEVRQALYEVRERVRAL